MSCEFEYKQALQYLELVGNSSHDARNMLAMKKRLEYPELQIIDTAVAQIEGQAREVIIIFDKDPKNALMRVKPILRSIYRSLIFMIKSVHQFKDLEYTPLDDKCFSELDENLNFQKTLIDHVDKVLNQQFASFLNPSNIQQQAKLDKMEEPYATMLNNMKFNDKPNYQGKEGCLENLTQYTKDICNIAHHIQSYVCPLQAVETVKVQANQIIGAAGNIENQTRAMLAAYDNSKSNIEQIKKVVINQSKAMGEQVKKINSECEILKKQNQEEMSKYLITILSWIVESFSVFEKAVKSQPNQLQFAF